MDQNVGPRFMFVAVAVVAEGRWWKRREGQQHRATLITPQQGINISLVLYSVISQQVKLVQYVIMTYDDSCNSIGNRENFIILSELKTFSSGGIHYDSKMSRKCLT